MRNVATDPLCSTLWISLRSTYPQNVDCSTISTEETPEKGSSQQSVSNATVMTSPVIKSVAVDATSERFIRSQREFHSIFVAHLRNIQTVSIIASTTHGTFVEVGGATFKHLRVVEIEFSGVAITELAVECIASAWLLLLLRSVTVVLVVEASADKVSRRCALPLAMYQARYSH